jgi:ribosomal protein L7Ae-like RNA K-turn-binding protein
MSSLPFTADTAQKLKKTMRSVQRDLAIAKGINHAVQEVIAGTPIADSVSPPAAVTVGQRAVEKHAFANSDGKTSDLNMGQLNQPRWPSG